MRINKIALNVNNSQILFLIINLTLNFFYIFFICKNNQEPIFTNGITKLFLANTFSFIFFISLHLKLINKGIDHKSNNIFSKTTSIILAFLMSFLFSFFSFLNTLCFSVARNKSFTNPLFFNSNVSTLVFSPDTSSQS